jgi:hypothetical protein
MIKTKHTLHTAQLTNNCPECFANTGLEFNFFQEEKENKFYKQADSSITETLYCNSCKSNIYPVNWTDDIERVYDYNKKLAVPKKSGVRPKLISYIIGFIAISLVAILITFLIN